MKQFISSVEYFTRGSIYASEVLEPKAAPGLSGHAFGDGEQRFALRHGLQGLTRSRPVCRRRPGFLSHCPAV